MNKKGVKNDMKWTRVLLCIMAFVSVSACSVYEMPEVHFFFKTTDARGPYSEDIEAFEIGQEFYTNIQIRLLTNKKKPRTYRVIVEIPKTDEVKMFDRGGWQPDDIAWDEEHQLSRLMFTIQGYKENPGGKISFRGIPKKEGQAKMKVEIYKEDFTPISGGKYFKELSFKYNLQE